MFDTMVLTKAVGAICATFLFFLVGKWIAETVYMPGHDEAHAHAVYPLPPEEGAEPASEEPAEEIDVMALYAEADASAGESLWRNCRSCHSLEGANGTGPHLDGVVGRAIDAVEGFNYSGALEQLGTTWDVETLFTFLADPRGTAPGTRMSFRGLPDPEDRVTLIKYLEEHPA